MSRTSLTTITPQHVAAAVALHNEAPEVAAELAAACRRFTATSTDPEDAAQVAGMLAPDLLNADRDNIQQAAAVAARRAAALYRAERDGIEPVSDLAALDDETDERGKPAHRIAAPWTPDPAAPFTTTNADRYADTLGALDEDDATTVAALLAATWKGGKVPARAVRTALDLPPVTGRAGTAWTAEVAAAADRLGVTLRSPEYGPTVDPRGEVAALYRSTLAVHHGRARRTIDAAAVAVDQAEKQHEPTTYGPRPTPQSGPASAPRLAYDRRAADRLGTLDGSTRRRATDADRLAALDAEAARQRVAPLTLDAWTPPSTKRPSAADVLEGRADAVPDEASAFDPMATTAEHRTAQRLPGVTVEKDGTAVAMSGAGAGSGNGSGAAVQTARPSRKAKGGSTGATVPVGGSRGAAVVQAVTAGKPSAAGMGSKAPCNCDRPAPSAEILAALAVVNYAGTGAYADADPVTAPAVYCPLHQVALA